MNVLYYPYGMSLKLSEKLNQADAADNVKSHFEKILSTDPTETIFSKMKLNLPLKKVSVRIPLKLYF